MSNDHDQNKENVSANTNVVEHDSTNWKPSEKSADAEQVTQANVETVNNEQNESSSEITQPDNKENEVTNSNDRQRAVAMGAKLSPEARDEAIAEQKERSNIPDPVTTETANADVEVELTTEDAVMGMGVGVDVSEAMELGQGISNTLQINKDLFVDMMDTYSPRIVVQFIVPAGNIDTGIDYRELHEAEDGTEYNRNLTIAVPKEGKPGGLMYDSVMELVTKASEFNNLEFNLVSESNLMDSMGQFVMRRFISALSENPFPMDVEDMPEQLGFNAFTSAGLHQDDPDTIVVSQLLPIPTLNGAANKAERAAKLVQYFEQQIMNADLNVDVEFVYVVDAEEAILDNAATEMVRALTTEHDFETVTLGDILKYTEDKMLVEDEQLWDDEYEDFYEDERPYDPSDDDDAFDPSDDDEDADEESDDLDEENDDSDSELTNVDEDEEENYSLPLSISQDATPELMLVSTRFCIESAVINNPIFLVKKL